MLRVTHVYAACSDTRGVGTDQDMTSIASSAPPASPSLRFDLDQVARVLDGALCELRVFFSEHAKLSTAANPQHLCASLHERMASCIDHVSSGMHALAGREDLGFVAPVVHAVTSQVPALEQVHDLVGQARAGEIPPVIPVQAVARTYAQVHQLRDVLGG
jgi:hypothetical protein